MIVVGSNLRQLITQHGVCSEQDFDGDSVKIRLGHQVKVPIAGRTVAFLATDRRGSFQDVELTNGRLVLNPHDCVLACSQENIRMPAGYIGELKPTSSSNRDFFSLTLGADYVAPGWEGRLTLELRNYGPFILEIPVEAHIGQLLIHRCSDAAFSKSSRYLGEDAPMYAIPQRHP